MWPPAPTSVHSPSLTWNLIFSLLTFADPTLPPTTAVPNTAPSDECDDDQASCHSGTGDDYDVTGANIALMRLQANPPPCPSFCYGSHSIYCVLPDSLLSVTATFDTGANLPSSVQTCSHACIHDSAGVYTALISCTCSPHSQYIVFNLPLCKLT